MSWNNLWEKWDSNIKNISDENIKTEAKNQLDKMPREQSQYSIKNYAIDEMNLKGTSSKEEIDNAINNYSKKIVDRDYSYLSDQDKASEAKSVYNGLRSQCYYENNQKSEKGSNSYRIDESGVSFSTSSRTQTVGEEKSTSETNNYSISRNTNVAHDVYNVNKATYSFEQSGNDRFQKDTIEAKTIVDGKTTTISCSKSLTNLNTNEKKVQKEVINLENDNKIKYEVSKDVTTNVQKQELVGEKPADKPLSMDMKDLCTDKQEALDAQS